MTIPQPILELIRRFDDNAPQYHDAAYNETEARREFIDPLFKALGWDVDNTQGYSEKYKEVVHEARVTVGGRVKAPDYAFRVGGRPVFFVEAKRPGVTLHAGREADEAAFQVRRYAWSAKLPVSVLTNFAEFALYDCRSKPARSEGAGIGRVAYYTHTQFPDVWDDLTGLLAPEAIRKGALDRFIASEKATRGTQTVDAAFLAEIEGWRDALARNIALRNPGLTVRDLNFAVQKTIDRLIFLRIAEDRGFEPYHRLGDLAQGKDVYRALGEVFRQADNRYNAGLFYFRQETDRDADYDDFTLDLQVDDKTLKDILTRLYYPESPYAFDALPADILGQVYEQFLGKVIRLTAGGRAKVEEKPEVKKAGGVYYTPTYIVDYIVEHTIGKLLEGKTWREVRGLDARGVQRYAPLRVLDPACGSGTFLLQAYQYLLDWYLEQYTEDSAAHAKAGRITPPVSPPLSPPPGGTKEIFPPPGGTKGGAEWRLTTEARKDILLTHLYGVDIDPQAVEVTKLSLLLKVLEGEDEATLGQQLMMSLGKVERVLPDLGQNIRCGNSLIGSDFYQGQQLGLGLLDDEEVYRINAFDWDKGFGKAMAAGGFDAVIGNPPYGFHEIHSEHEKPYFKQHFVASQGSFEHYFLFYEKSLRLLKKEGIHGFIVPVTWITIPSAHSLREFILNYYWVQEITWLPEFVFSNAKVNTLVSIIKNSPSGKTEVNIYDSLGFKESPKETRIYEQSHFVESDYYIGIFETQADSGILSKMTHCSQLLQELARPCSGYNPYEVGKGEKPSGGPHTKETVDTKPYHSDRRLGDEWKPEIGGRDLGRYHLEISGNRWIKYGPWLAAPRDPDNFLGKRILIQEITGGTDRRIVAAYCEAEVYYSRDVIPIKLELARPHPYYILGIVNSWLLSWYHHKRNPKAKKGLFPKILVSDLRKLPIRTIDFDDPADVAIHDRMVALVERMLDLHRRLAAAHLAHEKHLLQQQIDITDKAIDALVYELYALTPEEIAIVEGA